MSKICEMSRVREYMEGYAVELWVHDTTGRLVVVAENEGGNNGVYIDLLDLLDWCKLGPHR